MSRLLGVSTFFGISGPFKMCWISNIFSALPVFLSVFYLSLSFRNTLRQHLSITFIHFKPKGSTLILTTTYYNFYNYSAVVLGIAVSSPSNVNVLISTLKSLHFIRKVSVCENVICTVLFSAVNLKTCDVIHSVMYKAIYLYMFSLTCASLFSDFRDFHYWIFHLQDMTRMCAYDGS